MSVPSTMQQLLVGDVLNTAVQHYEAGRLLQAERLCRAILDRQPKDAYALHLLGAIAYGKGLYRQTIDLLREAIAENPNVPQFHNTVGAAFRAVGELQDAVAAYERAIFLDSTYCQAYMNMGNACISQGRYEEAAEAYNNVILLDPRRIEAYNSMAVALQHQEEYDAAIEKCRRALKLKPDDAETYNTAASILMKKGRYSEAIESFRRALQLKPDYVEAHCNLGMTLLLSGAFKEGWAEYQWRLKTERMKYARRYHVPFWDGSPFAGKRLVIHYEQGFGDNIQFIRYLPMVKRRAGTVICEMLTPLKGLLRGFPGIDELIDASFGGKPPVPCDLHVPLLELPRIFSTALQTVPADVPYLFADLMKAESWRARLAGPGFKVGIVWAGTPAHDENRNRSCHLRDFLRLSNIPGVQLIGLQKGDAAGQVRELAGKMTIMNLADELNDFADTAAVIKNLDLIISVDTAVLHLAGAMGKPTWALLSAVPDWRWMLDRQDSPWYPTMRLFRQKSYGDWEGVFERVVEELRILVGSAILKSTKL